MMRCHKCGYSNLSGSRNCANCSINLEWANANLPPFDKPTQIIEGSAAEKKEKIQEFLDRLLEDNEVLYEFALGHPIPLDIKRKELFDLIGIGLSLVTGEDLINRDKREEETWVVALTNRRVILTRISFPFFSSRMTPKILQNDTVVISDAKEISPKTHANGLSLKIVLNDRVYNLLFSPDIYTFLRWDLHALNLANDWKVIKD